MGLGEWGRLRLRFGVGERHSRIVGLGAEL